MNEYEIGQVIGRGRFYGVYQSPEEVPTFGINICDQKEYCEYYSEYEVPSFQSKIKNFPLKKLMMWGCPYFFTVLPIIRSIIATKKKVKIVDIGGGQGENYLFIEKFFGREYLEYHVVEQKRNCEFGRKLHHSADISFHENGEDGFSEEVKKLLERADICLLIGVLEFWIPYIDLIKDILQERVKYIFITRATMSSVVETFYSRQYVAPSNGMYKDTVLGDNVITIINHKELIQQMQNLGYDIVLDLFQRDGFMEAESLPYPYNQIEYRDMLFQLRE